MGLISNFLYCTGPVFANDLTTTAVTRGLNQIWGARIDTTATWSWAYTYARDNGTEFLQISVKHSQMQIPQSVLLALTEKGIIVLPFWGLNPRETPDLNHTSWIVPVSNVRLMTNLGANGGVFAVVDQDLKWIPIVQPYSLNLATSIGTVIPLTSETATRSTMSSTTRSVVTRTSSGTGTYPTPNAFSSSSSYAPVASDGPYPLYQLATFGAIRSVYLSHDSFTLFVLTNDNGTTVYTMQTNGPTLLTSPLPLIVLPDAATCMLTHPRTSDLYIAINGGILIYNATGTLKGKVIATFSNIRTLEMDNEGRKLYIGGEEQGRGRLDTLDLIRFSLSNSKNVQPGHLFVVMLVFYCILS